MRAARSLGPLAILLATAGSADAAVRYVRQNGADVGGCTSSSSPCATIQYAVDQSATGDTIRLALGGIYRENVQLTAAIASLTIEGGWADEFGWQLEDPAVTVIDGDDEDPVFLVQPAGDTQLRLEYLTIQNGRGRPYGGGVAVHSLSASTDVEVILEHVTLKSNHAGTGGGAAARGIAGVAELRVNYSRVEDNIAGEGGGVAAVADLGGRATVTLESSTVTGNEAQDWIDSEGYGGALYADSTREGTSEIDATNSLIVKNESEGEGGIYGSSGYCAGCGDDASTDIALLNSTVTENNHSGIVARSWDHGQTRVDLVNTIAWGNTYFDVEATGDYLDTVVTAWYADVQRTDIGHDAVYNVIGDVFDVDPLFVDAANDDYHLSAESELIDAGLCGFYTPGYVRLAPLADFDGELRPPLGQVWNCDVGADEYLPFERWVSPGGTDSANTCIDPQAPCATVQHALDQAVAGGGRYRHAIGLASGSYAENLTIVDSLAPVVLQGGWSGDFGSRQTSAHDTVIDAGGLGSALAFAASGGRADLRLESLTLTGGMAADGGGLSFLCTLGHGRLVLRWVVLEGNTATDTGGGLRVRPIACSLEVQIDDTMIVGNSAANGGGGASMRIDDGADANTRLRFTTLAGNDAGYAGGLIYQQTGSGRGWLFLDSTLLTLNTGTAGGQDDLWIYEAGSNFVYVDADDSDIQTVTQYGGVYLPSNTVISVNPGFADAAGGNFHLTPYSPVRDLGYCYLGSPFDCDGDSRPPTVGCDMGADEYAGGWVPPLDLWITNERLDGVQVREACRSITVGPEVVVETASTAELRAGTILVFDNGFQVASGGSLTAWNYFHPDCLVPWPGP